ncbi:UDP-4-amino-4,6-dideoxy-N-acetyl-beta-L-altrosamine transaminase [Acetivibrio mesophilus]|uniref:UDP-4-amino-4, 6-dideoxy-N-acetyl-beta-L-altrosamine transaminase n=1 Tax=Acetivibrio mesophilus TaxID=2487273 RepID=A0A4V1K226_9FIRM|nr:UDP-4-amino-4,6-dideoxy-N-acetyl-beta-L-altrosamine transaminase [Acetivibrio mesophilus]ODM27345.1 UDP-4-amino-4,6-dideoxy-N-acetyl-beta-L-altrosamine transaminase [Clostridium sp. Bc-iso-3]RXE58819.1 UDP-4-amino-4,6-dideoxy-N-acetyl-beta-L-altrosamine transaminase [Acetivibrio mesophilus]HHV28948.1 UDP-4-amino-4,6-dideoxy-N-acetyl-beta-L-altrosamine transaminase [Clostridium sp.]
MDKEQKFIPYGRQWIDEDDINAVVEVLRGDYLTTGPKIKEFEENLAKYTGAKYAVAISNGTAALHAACFAAGIKEGDEVITTPITFAASANCLLYMGAKPVFADIDPDTYNIDPKEIRAKITEKTKAIIPVHFTGQPCDMDEILRIAKEYNLLVIEDGAHAIGAEYKGRKIGILGDMTTFSFHPVKHITTGEGGAITTNSEELYKKLTLFRTHGITREKEELLENHGSWYYEQQYLGYNYRMTDIQAALGISQLKKSDRFLQLRRDYAKLYTEAFESINELVVPYQLDGTNSSWHLYILKLKPERLDCDRKKIFEELQARKIGVNVHYIPVYYHPFYKKLGYIKGLCPQAEDFYERIITLPLFPKMEREDVRYVISNVKDVLQKHII